MPPAQMGQNLTRGGWCTVRTLRALMARGMTVEFHAGPGQWERIEQITNQIEGQPADFSRTYLLCTSGTAYRIWTTMTVPCRIVREESP